MANDTPSTIITIISRPAAEPQLDMRIWLQTADGPHPGLGAPLNREEAITTLDALLAVFAKS